MDPTCEAHVTFVDVIRDLFGDYRAEWPPEHFANHFVRPAYFAKLESARPCLLFGGRGTGKTTALRSLRFDAAHTRILTADPSAPAVEGLPYIGIYLRMDKNQVLTFEGPELSEREWGKLFVHYFNLLVCREFCLFLLWVASIRPDLPLPTSHEVALLAKAAGVVASTPTPSGFRVSLDEAIVALELYANNPKRLDPPVLSAPHSAVRAFAEVIAKLPWASDRPIFCCIDEYENLLKGQQSALNTYVKHSTTPLSYKLGVRSNGLYSRATIDNADQLQTPDDYIEIDITEEGFDLFAQRVAEVRLARTAEIEPRLPRSIADFLAALPVEEEAQLLGVERIKDGVLAQLSADIFADLRAFVSSQTPLRIALLGYWCEAHPGQSLPSLAADWRAHPEAWATRFGNYNHSLLFWLSKGRKGALIKKYYTGCATFLAMASGNIRYFMELLDRSIAFQLASSGFEGKVFALSPRAQTMAAKTVGQKRLDQLEGVSGNGVRLKRLVLGVGRVFFERTRTPGTAPEQSAFTVGGSPDDVNTILELLADGVGHLAFESFARSKRTSGAEPGDLEYRIHPIYSAVFEISHRRKRRIAFDASVLLELIESPAAGISKLLGNGTSGDDELPEQLGLFAAFFREKPSSKNT